MKLFRLSNLFVLICVFASGSALFSISQKVQDAENTLDDLYLQVQSEEEQIRVLSAEWDYLNNPARLEQLALKYLKLQGLDDMVMMKQASDIPKPFMPNPPAFKPDSRYFSISYSPVTEEKAP